MAKRPRAIWIATTIVLAIGAGIVSAGVVGGLLAVPIIAFGNTAVRYLLGHPVVHGTERSGDPPSAELYGGAEPDEPQWDRRDVHAAIPGVPPEQRHVGDAGEVRQESPQTSTPTAGIADGQAAQDDSDASPHQPPDRDEAGGDDR